MPGVTFGSSFPRLARLADRLAIVRSFVPGDANHDIKPVVGKDTFGANLGAVYAHLAGANHPETGMPRNLALFPRAVDPSTQPGTMNFGNFGATGPFAPATGPFQPGAGGSLQSDMKLALSADRFDDRRALLAELDRAWASLDVAQRARNRWVAPRRPWVCCRRRGGRLRPVAGGRRTVARYTAPLVRPENIDKVEELQQLRGQREVARQADASGGGCASGAGFVTVTTNFVWDMHSDVNNAPVERMRYMGPPLDHARPPFSRTLRPAVCPTGSLVCCGRWADEDQQERRPTTG